MGRILGILFFLLAALAFVIHLWINAMRMDLDGPQAMINGLSGGLSSTLALTGFGLVYWFIGKAAPNTVSWVFGWIHIVMAVLNQALYAGALYTQSQLINGYDGVDLATLGLLFGSAHLLFIVGMASHLVAIIAAIAAPPGGTRSHSFS